MRENGIRAKTKQKFKVTKESSHNYPVAENILGQNSKATEINKKWVSDITYLWKKKGWLYLAYVLDLCSRMIVGRSIDKHLSSLLMISSLSASIINRGENLGLIFHSNRGGEYVPSVVRTFCKDIK